MAISPHELYALAPTLINTTGSNGGWSRHPHFVIPDAVQYLISNLSSDQRSSGDVLYYKVFIRAGDDDNASFANVKLYSANALPEKYFLEMFLGTESDTQADIIATPPTRIYSNGILDVQSNPGDTVIEVNTRKAALDFLQNGDKIYVSQYYKDVDPGGNIITTDSGVSFEYREVVGSPVYNGDVATVTLDAPLAFTHVIDTLVSSVIESGNLVGSVDNYSITSASGTYDDTLYPIISDAIGSSSGGTTVTFTSGTAFEAVLDRTGSVLGAGNITTDFQPQNTYYSPSRDYLTIPAAGWGGTWQLGDTLKFDVNAQSVPAWLRLTVEPAAPAANSNWQIIIDGDAVN